MLLDISQIQFSRADKKHGLMLPTLLNSELAEFLGIMVGDGHVAIYQTNIPKKRKYYVLQISGHIEDKKYQMDYINNLIFKLFNIQFHVEIIPNNHIIILRKQSQAICEFLIKIFGLPSKKMDVAIPPQILEANKTIQAAFLRGLADSDFCFTVKHKPNIYPLVCGSSISKILIEQCSGIFTKFGIPNYYRKEQQHDKKRNKTYTIYKIYINGFSRVKLFMDKIGFQNKNKMKKYETALRLRNIEGMKHIPKCFRP